MLRSVRSQSIPIAKNLKEWLRKGYGWSDFHLAGRNADESIG